MAERAKLNVEAGPLHRDALVAEKLDDETAERIRNVMALVVEMGQRQICGEETPANSKLMKELNRQMKAVGREYLSAAERGNAARLQAFIDHSFLVNYQDPETGETALHIVAANGARKALRVLMGTDKCKYLVRDKQGRLPSELAYLYGDDPAMARLLAIKEMHEAVEGGRKATRRPSTLHK